MSSILDALDKARRDRARALGGDPAPAAPPPLPEPGGSGSAPRSTAEADRAANATADSQAAPPPPPARLPAPEYFAYGRRAGDVRGPGGGRSVLIGAVIALVLVVVVGITAVAVSIAVRGPKGPAPQPAPAEVRYVEVAPPSIAARPDLPASTPSPMIGTPPPSPAPAASPTPDPERGIVITDLRFSDTPAGTPDDGARRITLTPAPTPRVPLASTGEAPVLLGEPAATPTPKPTPAPPGLVIERSKPMAGEVFAEDFTPFLITAILLDGDSRAVIVRGRQRHEGEVIEGYKITTIDKDRVLLDNEGTTVTVRF